MSTTLNSNQPMAFLLLYILEKEFGVHLSRYANGDLSVAIRETLDELAFDHIGDLFATNAERTFDPAKEISLIDTRDFAEDIIRFIPPDRPAVGRAYNMLGHVCFHQGDHIAAVEHFKKAILIFEAHHMESHLHEAQSFLLKNLPHIA